MSNITFRAPDDLKDDLDEKADEEDLSRTDIILRYIRKGLYEDETQSQHDAQDEITRLQNRVEELESELREVRSERDELLGELKAKQDELEDLREWRNSAVGTLARTPAIEGDETLVGAVEAETEESESEWWRFWG